MTPHQKFIAFQIWRHCDPLEWDVTVRDVAESLGISRQKVTAICKMKGWTHRFHKARRGDQHHAGWDIGGCAIDRIDDYIK